MTTASSSRFGSAMDAFSESYDRESTERLNALNEVTEEIARVEQALASLQLQLASLREAREDNALAVTTTPSKAAVGRARLRELLIADRDLLAQRAQEMVDAAAAREARVDEAMKHGEAAELVAEITKFESETMKVLDAIPASMRPVLMAGYEGWRTKLEEHRQFALGDAPTASGEPLHLELAYAIDAPEGMADLFTALLPVLPPVRVREGDTALELSARFAAQVTAAVRSAFASLGVDGVECYFGEFEGLVAVEAEVPEQFPVAAPRLHELLNDAFAEAFGHADLRAARLTVVAYNAGVDYLLPPEEDAIGETEELQR